MTWPEYLKNLKEVVLNLDKDFGLRDTTIAKRKRVHKAMMDNGLDVTHKSDEHSNIITKIIGAKK